MQFRITNRSFQCLSTQFQSLDQGKTIKHRHRRRHPPRGDVQGPPDARGQDRSQPGNAQIIDYPTDAEYEAAVFAKVEKNLSEPLLWPNPLPGLSASKGGKAKAEQR